MPARPRPVPTSAVPKILARPLFRESDGLAPIKNLLSHEQAQSLLEIAELVDYPRAGMVVFSQGAEGTYFYSISKGCVRISRSEGNGDRQVLAFMWPGDLLGLAENGRYVNTAETVQGTRLFRFRTTELRALVESDPALKLQILMKAAHELRRAQRLITVLGQHRTDQRLAAFLLELTREGHFFDPRTRELNLPMSRSDIADYLGSSPETVARAFAALEEAHMVQRISPRVLRIAEVAALEEHIRASHPGRAVTG